MTQPLVATKLFIPRVRPGLVARDRLLRRLEDGAATRLTLVSAPPGYGKTTLLASWLARRGGARTRGDCAVAWLSLDAGDSDPASFWRGVATALRGAISAGGVPSEQLTASSAVADVSVPAVLNYLAETPRDVLLVLDDFHAADQPEVAAGLSFLVEHLPPHAHVVLCTRADPDLALARWRARGELVEIRAEDLRFTPQETATYLERADIAPLTVAQVAALDSRTEGWIAALQLAAISLAGRTDVAAFVEGFAGDNRFVVDYLVEEVLARQSPPVREFLLRSAVLERFCASLCDAVLARHDSDQMLRTLERANLFLVALDDRREWFRYHPLFADVLRARLRGEHPESVSLMHERAGRWFEEHELIDPAIRHTLAAGEVERAATLIEDAIPDVRRHRREAMARSWLEDVPEGVIVAKPALAVLSAGLAMVGGDLEAVRTRLDDAERALADQMRKPHPNADDTTHHDTGNRRRLLATVAIYRASLAQARGDTEETVRHAQHALDVAGPTDHLSRGAAAGFLGLAAWARGDVRQALRTFGEAVAFLHAAGNVVDELSGTVVLADMWRAAGHPQTARELCDDALRRAEEKGESVGRAIAELHVAVAELDIEAGDLARAREHLETATTWSRRTGLTESVSRHFVAKALLARAHGDFIAADGYLDEAEQFYRPGFVPDLRPVPALRARFQISQGDLDTASDWARQREVRIDEPAQPLREFDLLTLARLLAAEHRIRPRDDDGTSRLMVLLRRLHEAAEHSGQAPSWRSVCSWLWPSMPRGDERRHSPPWRRCGRTRRSPTPTSASSSTRAPRWSSSCV